jgi:C4-dicarboxylate-specific signal transduction histidine kinase
MELVILNGDMEGARFPMDAPNITVGRKSDNDICLPLDSRISRFHAELRRRDHSSWVLEDLNSVNGTFVGQRRIHAPTVLRVNDRLRMGRTWMTLRDDSVGASSAHRIEAVQLSDADIHAAKEENVVYAVSAEQIATERELEHPREYLQVYEEVGRALSSTLDVNELGNVIMTAVMECLAAERGFLLLLDRETGDLIPTVARQREGVKNLEDNITISRHILDKAINERAAILTTDAMTDERFQEIASVRDFQIRSAICAPLVRKEDVMGVIYLDTTSATHVFGERDVDLIAGVAAQASVAIDNARLYTDLRNAYEELKSAQQQLVASEKLSTIGTLAATVAHDMINIVTPLQPLIDIMLRNADVDPEDEEAVRRQTKRLSALAERLMSFSQSEDVSLRPAAINDIVASTISLLNTEINHNSIELEMDLADDLPEVLVDETHIDRVFLNLCLNAIEALEETANPHLTIRTYQDQDEVVISFRDNGPGIPADSDYDVFEPFLTTKEMGTGLGLFSCRRIIQGDHNGVIEYESEPGQGTIFTVRLPVPAFDGASPASQ